MYDGAVLWEWSGFALRWLHVVTAIAWIGSSFYFIALDLGLRTRPGMPPGVGGEAWQVHGGGFYHVQKYLVAPDAMPEELIWFKWESYATWLSGMALLGVIYYAGADLYLIDPAVAAITPGAAIAVSLGSMGAGWVVYDLICRRLSGVGDTGLMILLYGVLVAAAWGYGQIFSGRAAFVHVGALTATIMTANVFFVIIPGQKKITADLVAKRRPDPALGIRAKQRSIHNNYLTLPVLFLMLSNHNPLAFATRYGWVIASLVFLMGVAIRHYFNARHARSGNPAWTWLVAALVLIVIMWLSTARLPDGEEEAALTPSAARFAAAETFTQVHDTITGRCAMCHARKPLREGMFWPPKGVVLETRQQVAALARDIYLQSGVSRAMPPANVSFMRPEERAVIREWYEGVVAPAESP